MFCKEQVEQLHDMAPQFHDAGAELIIVGNGAPDQAANFVAEHQISTPVFTDPTMEVYRVVGARKGVLPLLHPKAFLNRIRSLLRGYRQSRTMGSKTQQGGVLIIMPDGSVPYRFMSKASGDHPAPEAVLGTLKSALEKAD